MVEVNGRVASSTVEDVTDAVVLSLVTIAEVVLGTEEDVVGTSTAVVEETSRPLVHAVHVFLFSLPMSGCAVDRATIAAAIVKDWKCILVSGG